MKKRIFLCFLMTSVILFSACSPLSPSQNNQTKKTEGSEQTSIPDQENPEQKNELILSVNGKNLDVKWEENDTVFELTDYVKDKSITVHSARYGGFEQVGSLPQSFSRSDVQMTAKPGDIVLYSGNQLVLLFGSNTWSYTKLGHIQGLTEAELIRLLDRSSAEIEIEWR